MEETAEAPKPADQKVEEPKYVFPDTSKGGVMHFDQATHSFWIGFRFPGNGWEDIKLWLDRVKFDAFQIWKQYAEAQKQADNLSHKMQRDQANQLAKMENQSFVKKLFKH